MDNRRVDFRRLSPFFRSPHGKTGLIEFALEDTVEVALRVQMQRYIALFGQFVIGSKVHEESFGIGDIRIIRQGCANRDAQPILKERPADGYIQIIRSASGVCGLSATDVYIHEFAHFGVSHRGIQSAVDDRRQGISRALCSYVAFAYVHTRSQQRCRQTFTRIFVDGFELTCYGFVVGRFEEESDTTYTN